MYEDLLPLVLVWPLGVIGIAMLFPMKYIFGEKWMTSEFSHFGLVMCIATAFTTSWVIFVITLVVHLPSIEVVVK